MELLVRPKISIKKTHRVGEFWYDPDEDSIAYDGPFFLPLQLKVTKLSKIEVTPMFLKFPTILRGCIDVNLLSLLLDSIKLINEEKLLLHGSCYERDGRGILNVGFQNTGKTYNTLKAVSEGAYLISEEYTVIDEKKRACPYKPTVRSCLSWTTIRECNIYIQPRKWVSLVLRTLRAKVLPFLFEAAVYKEFKVSRLVTSVYEIRTKGKVIEGDIAKKLTYYTENEYNFFACDMLVAYAYASGFDLFDIQLKRRTLIKFFINNVIKQTIKGT